MSARIQRPDSNSGSRALLVLAGGTLLGLAIILLLQEFRPSLEGWIQEDPQPPQRLQAALAILGAAGAIPFLVIALYLWRFSKRIQESGRFPPPGVTVLRDTRVLTGKAALAQMRIWKFLAIAFGVIGIAIPLVLWSVVRVVSAGPGVGAP